MRIIGPRLRKAMNEDLKEVYNELPQEERDALWKNVYDERERESGS